MTDGALKLLEWLRNVSGTGSRYGGGGRWLRHRTVANSGLNDHMTELRKAGLVESYGKGRNRRHALTRAGQRFKLPRATR